MLSWSHPFAIHVLSRRTPKTVPQVGGLSFGGPIPWQSVLNHHSLSVGLNIARARQAIPLVHGTPVNVRTTNGISSCGSAWMPRNDVTIGQGTDTRCGFNTAVQIFCDAANGQVVAPSGYLSMATEVFLNGGNDPTTYGILGFVYCKPF